MIGIIGGTVFDPLNKIEGQQDIWIKDGKIVSKQEIDPDKVQIIDAKGQVIMPGGVDIHSHIAGPKVNAGRKLCPEDSRRLLRPRKGNFWSGSGYTVPSTSLTGYLYSEMGYTTAMEAASAPIIARHTHEELQDIPNLDKGAFLTMGNNHFIMDCIRNNEMEKARDYVAWLLGAGKGFAIKIVNPGGVENWKYGKNVHSLDDEVIGFGVTPRQILTTLAKISEELKLPHPVHIHGLQLGHAGSDKVTIETMEMMEAFKAHYCHLQFLSYTKVKGGLPRSGAVKVAETINSNPNITIDVGQIIFGPATTMTSDGPVPYNLSQKLGAKWVNDDVESESGGGLVPMVYKPGNALHAVMWMTGLELFLLVDDPWQVFLTTDHPNAGPFLGYPEVIRLLMDKEYRNEQFEKIPKKAKEGALLPQLSREYSLSEIAIITRGGPAKRLGLKNKGHLGIGADADITVYTRQENKQEMFAHPSRVIKEGNVVVIDGELVREQKGRTFYVSPDYDENIEPHLREHFKKAYTISFDNYAIEADHLGVSQKINCS